MWNIVLGIWGDKKNKVWSGLHHYNSTNQTNAEDARKHLYWEVLRDTLR